MAYQKKATTTPATKTKAEDTKVEKDTVKETVILSNISKKALDEIETQITEYMMTEKQKYNGVSPNK